MLTHCKCKKYADDTQIYYHALPSKLDDALGLDERDAQAIADWALKNGLELNTKKTQVIILGSAHYTSSIIDLTRLRKICEQHAKLILYTTEVKKSGGSDEPDFGMESTSGQSAKQSIHAKPKSIKKQLESRTRKF